MSKLTSSRRYMSQWLYVEEQKVTSTKSGNEMEIISLGCNSPYKKRRRWGRVSYIYPYIRTHIHIGGPISIIDFDNVKAIILEERFLVYYKPRDKLEVIFFFILALKIERRNLTLPTSNVCTPRSHRSVTSHVSPTK